MVFDYKKEGKIAIFTLNRPEARNAHTLELLRAMHKAMMDFREDPELWVGIITGAGTAFCAGADIKELFPYWREHRAERWAIPLIPEHGVEAFESWKPLIAAINGPALAGGMELALACDIRIASEKARFGLPEVRVGVLPAGGATWRLPRSIPWCKAAELIFTGRIIDAQKALQLGLVNEVVPPEQLMPKAREWAEAICECSPLAVRAAKEAMVRGTVMSEEDSGRLEHALFGYLLDTEDGAEGRAAFIEKRTPVWKGR